MGALDNVTRFPLRHLHLPGLTPYLHASVIQSRLVRIHRDHKALRKLNQPTTPPPGPTLITFQTPPTYTCGRRDIGNLAPSQIAHLRNGGQAEFYEALRGGQTTFHGPGQLTAYLILTLDAHNLTPRSHVRLLEASVIDTCSSIGFKGFITHNPGVWVTKDKKIASVGVHLKRMISSHGIGLNIFVDLKWFDRIVVCGLPEKRATSFEKEGVDMDVRTEDERERYMEKVADILASKVQEQLPKVHMVERITEKDVMGVEHTPLPTMSSHGEQSPIQDSTA